MVETSSPSPTDPARIAGPIDRPPPEGRVPEGRGFKALVRRVLTTHASPRRLATAVSVGGFVGATPWVGVKTWLCLGVAQVFRLNKPAILLGLNLFNPIVLPFVFYLEFRVGTALLGRAAEMPDLAEFQVGDVAGLFWPIMLGSLPVGAALSAVLYVLTLTGARRYRSRSAPKYGR